MNATGRWFVHGTAVALLLFELVADPSLQSWDEQAAAKHGGFSALPEESNFKMEDWTSSATAYSPARR